MLRGLDVLVCAGTMPAHLAGALGVRTWLLLPHESDWRCMSGRDDSPWSTSPRLFRKDRAGDWSGGLRRVAAALEELAELPRPA